MDDAILEQGVQASPVVAARLKQEVATFLAPLRVWLDGRLDRRLVQTFVSGIVALLEWRNRAHGLLLSELGAYVLDPAHAPAGTKRLSNVLRSPNWSASDLSTSLWQQADQRLVELEASGEPALVVWDSSVLEKPESLASPDLGSVRSSKAKRLTRIKPGFYHPPSRPICVPGWQWLGLLLLGCSGQSGPPTVVHMRWWTNRGPHASDRRSEEGDLLERSARRWGQRVCHVWDRGFAGMPDVAQRGHGLAPAFRAALARTVQTAGATHRVAAHQSLGASARTAQLGPSPALPTHATSARGVQACSHSRSGVPTTRRPPGRSGWWLPAVARGTNRGSC